MDHLTSDFSDLLHSSKSSVYGGPALEDDNPFAELQGNPSQVWASAAEFEASAPRNTSQDVPEASAVPDVPPESPGSVQSQGSQEQAVPGSPVSHKPDSQPPGLHIEAPFDLSRTSTPAESSYSAVVSPSLPSEQQESLFSSAPDDETPIQRSPDTSSSTPTATALDVRPDEHTTSVPETSADPWGERQPSHEPSPYNITSHTETGTETEPAARGHQETPPASEPPADFTLHQNDHEVSHDDVEAASISLTPEPSRPNYLITVSDPQKVGSDVTGSSHTVYTVKSISSAQGSQPRQVLRRFSDFLWLYDTLCANNPGCIVPPPPEKHAIGRFSGDFVEQRRKGLQVFLGKVAAHPMLWNDHDFAMFLTSDTFVLDIRHRPAPAPPATPSFSLSGLLSSAPRFTESSEFISSKQSALSALEPSLRTLTASLHAASKSRAHVAHSVQELSVAVAALQTCGLSTPAKTTLSGLQELHAKLSAIQEKLSLSAESDLVAMFDSWVRLASTSVKHALNARVKLWQTWQKQLSVLRSIERKRESQGDTWQAEQREAEQRSDHAKREYEDSTKLVSAELVRFEVEKGEDFRLALASYVDSLCKAQAETLAAWEAYQRIVMTQSGSNTNEERTQGPSNGTTGSARTSQESERVAA